MDQSPVDGSIPNIHGIIISELFLKQSVIKRTNLWKTRKCVSKKTFLSGFPSPLQTLHPVHHGKLEIQTAPETLEFCSEFMRLNPRYSFTTENNDNEPIYKLREGNFHIVPIAASFKSETILSLII